VGQLTSKELARKTGASDTVTKTCSLIHVTSCVPHNHAPNAHLLLKLLELVKHPGKAIDEHFGVLILT
jgi:hypothetical protein